MAMQNINWNYPTSIWFGLDRIKEIQKACDELKINNPLIVTDPGILIVLLKMKQIFLVKYSQIQQVLT